MTDKTTRIGFWFSAFTLLGTLIFQQPIQAADIQNVKLRDDIPPQYSQEQNYNGDTAPDCMVSLHFTATGQIDDTLALNPVYVDGDYIRTTLYNPAGQALEVIDGSPISPNTSSWNIRIETSDFGTPKTLSTGIIVLGGSTPTFPYTLVFEDILNSTNYPAETFDLGPTLANFTLTQQGYEDYANIYCTNVEINPILNQPPIANAGPDQTNVGANTTAAITGVASTDPENQTLSYNWSQTLGSPVTWLTGSANSVAPSFTMPADSFSNPVEFQLIVNDGVQNSTPDTITLTAIRDVPVNTGGSTTIKHIIGRPIKKTTVVRPRDLPRPTVVKPNTGGMKVTEPDGSHDAPPEKKKALPPRR